MWLKEIDFFHMCVSENCARVLSFLFFSAFFWLFLSVKSLSTSSNTSAVASYWATILMRQQAANLTVSITRRPRLLRSCIHGCWRVSTKIKVAQRLFGNIVVWLHTIVIVLIIYGWPSSRFLCLKVVLCISSSCWKRHYIAKRIRSVSRLHIVISLIHNSCHSIVLNIHLVLLKSSVVASKTIAFLVVTKLTSILWISLCNTVAVALVTWGVLLSLLKSRIKIATVCNSIRTTTIRLTCVWIGIPRWQHWVFSWWIICLSWRLPSILLVKSVWIVGHALLKLFFIAHANCRRHIFIWRVTHALSSSYLIKIVLR